MLRPSRPFTIALLWLAIVLLPLRAWAATTMPVAMAAAPVVAMQLADAALPEPAAPCHGESHVADEAPQTCSLCGVCHSVFAAPPGVAAAVSALAQVPPADASVPAVEPAALAGPERPPRLGLV